MAINTGAQVKGFRLAHSTLESRMAAFDRLPREIRDALNDSPTPWSTASVLKFYREHGTARTLRWLAQANERFIAAVRAERETAIAQIDAARFLSDLGL